MGMKKHGSKKDALPVDNSKKEPQRLTWKSKYEQIQASHVTNGTEEPDSKEEDETKTNALDGLSGYLSSEDSSSGESELNEEVQNFLKEVDDLYKEDQKKQQSSSKRSVESAVVPAIPVTSSGPEMAAVQYEQTSAPTVAWQECYDSTTGFTYYWNMETNEVTWDMPAEYQSYMEALKQWQQYQAQGVAALLQVRVQQQLQQQQLLLQQAQAQKLSKSDVKTPGAKGKKRPSVKQSDSEDEKIELITSYGPFSDEESSDTEKVQVKSPKAKKKKTDTKSSSPKPSMGPQLPPGGRKLIRRIEKPKPIEKPAITSTSSLVPYHPDVDDSDTEETLENSKLNFVPDNGPPGAEPEKIITDSSPKKEEKKAEVENAMEVDKNHPKKKEEEDDEVALLDRLKSQTQVLKELGGEIPEEVKSIITENNEKEEGKSDDSKEIKNLKVKLSARAKKLISASTTTAKARATDFVLTPDGLKPIEKNKESSDDTVPSKSEEPDKRKRLWQGLSPSLLAGESVKPEEVRIREEGNRGGFGFVPSDEGKKRLKTDNINFVKADIFHLSEDENKGESADEDEELTKEVLDIQAAAGVLNDKMKFLSEGKEPVPPVQIWMIQLETLLSAWENKCLMRNFLEDWLMRTSNELESLECSVAPDGWVCEWQRSEKRYQYRKLSTGEITWEFPALATGGGEEEMDLSTTPPPPPSTPPPPIISVPSPPSPPCISEAPDTELCPPPPPPPPPDIKPPPPLIPDEAPPLPGEVPPLPPLPPTPPPPPPPKTPPVQAVHPSQPLPPGVDPPDLPPLPPSSSPDYPPLPPPPLSPSSVLPPPPTIYPSQYYQPFPQPQQLPPPPIQPPLPTGEPVSTPNPSHDLSSELDSFYSDLATLEPEEPALPPHPPTDPPLPLPPPPETLLDANLEKSKKKKKTKLAPGLSLKKKGVSSLVAKWQQVQEDVRRDMKHD